MIFNSPKKIVLLVLCFALFTATHQQSSTSDQTSDGTSVHETTDLEDTTVKTDASSTNNPTSEGHTSDSHSTDEASTHDAQTTHGTDAHSPQESTNESTDQTTHKEPTTEHQTSGESTHKTTEDKTEHPTEGSSTAAPHESTQEHTPEETTEGESTPRVSSGDLTTHDGITDGPTTQDSHSTDSGVTNGPETTTSDDRLNYCPQVYPACSCFLSPVVMKCDNFDEFSQLDFKKLINEDDEPYSVYELELAPNKLTMLKDLDLTGLNKTYLSKVLLRNVDGFDYFSNPFEDVKHVNDDLRLFVYGSRIQFYLTGAPNPEGDRVPLTGVHCDLKLLEDQEEYNPIFSSFNFISFGASLAYPDELCPLAFRNSHIRLIQFYGLESESEHPLKFGELKKSSKATVTELNSNITNMNILDTTSLLLGPGILNVDVFERLYQLNVEGTSMKAIEEDTFKYINSLRRVILFLENMADFIRGSSNAWLPNLNGDVRVNLEDPDDVAANKDKQMILTFNDRTNGQKYDWPDKDIRYFLNFPHDKLVFPRILANVDIKSCTLVLGWLYLYKDLANNQADLNTTSSSVCLLGESITTTTTTTTGTTTTSTTVTIPTTVVQITQPSKFKFTNTEFYVTLGVLIGAVAVLILAVVVLFYKNSNLKSNAKRVGDEYSLQRF